MHAASKGLHLAALRVRSGASGTQRGISKDLECNRSGTFGLFGMQKQGLLNQVPTGPAESTSTATVLSLQARTLRMIA